MLRSAFSQLKAHPGRFLAVCLAIVLGVGFAASTTVYTESFSTALARSAAADTSKVDVNVDYLGNGDLDAGALAAIPGVALVDPVLTSYPEFDAGSSRGSLALTNIPEDERLRWYSVDTGTWPTGTDQLAVDLGTAERNNLSVGSTLTVTDYDGASRQLSITAILDTQVSALADSSDNGYGTDALLRALGSGDAYRASLLATPGTDPDRLATTVESAMGSDYEALTGTEIGRLAVQNITDGTDIIAIILFCFAALAGLVAAMVVANTFTILLTQRQRQIALMRCIGATGSQVRRATLAEAVLVAILGSLLGVAVGIGVGRIAIGFSDMTGRDFTLDIGNLVIIAVIGVIVSVIAALAPTARATRIPPLAALRPVSTPEHTKTVSIARNGFGLLLFLGGGALLAGGVYLHDLTVATGGGALTAIGVLLLLRSALPYVLRLFGGLGALAGTPGKLAVANCLRNPGRAAATCTALVVGVGAIVTLQVAAASAKAGADADLAMSRPLDLQISGSAALPPTLEASIAAIDGVATVEPVVGTEIEYSFPGAQETGTATAFGIDPTQVQNVLLAGRLDPGTVAAPGWAGMSPGDPITISRNGKSLTLRTSAQKITDDGSFTLAAADLAVLDPNARPMGLFLKFDEDASPNAVIAAINPLLTEVEGMSLSGSGPERAELESLLDTLIRVALALLAVAVVIAVVGIGNTLGLSVVERTRESALLRALGLRRRQLRQMLAVEAILLAVVAAVVGIFFGVLFGFAAVTAAFGEAGRNAELTIPWAELGLVFLGAIVAGVLASALPARRAAKATPIQALAEV